MSRATFAPERHRIARVSDEFRAAVLPRMGCQISGRQLAAEIGWPYPAVERWLSGRNIPTDAVREASLVAWIERHPMPARR